MDTYLGFSPLWFFPKKITNEQEKIINNLFNLSSKKANNQYKFKLKKPARIFGEIEYEKFLQEGSIWTMTEIREKGEIEWL
jgi:hypothetical protein